QRLALPDLPSFPTRRSSALSLPASAASLENASPLDCHPSTGLRRAAVANDLRNWLPQRPVFFCGGAQDPTVNFLSTQATAGHFRDRKSTRLNSSHVKISYAV